MIFLPVFVVQSFPIEEHFHKTWLMLETPLSNELAVLRMNVDLLSGNF
jgi:hypothetical protein